MALPIVNWHANAHSWTFKIHISWCIAAISSFKIWKQSSCRALFSHIQDYYSQAPHDIRSGCQRLELSFWAQILRFAKMFSINPKPYFSLYLSRTTLAWCCTRHMLSCLLQQSRITLILVEKHSRLCAPLDKNDRLFWSWLISQSLVASWILMCCPVWGCVFQADDTSHTNQCWNWA